jgi:hypothetical protein
VLFDDEITEEFNKLLEKHNNFSGCVSGDGAEICAQFKPEGL